MKRLRHDKRGVSNVIVVMLSLILIVIIVGNVILWSYEMNQLDWERMQERVALTNAEHIAHSPWFTSTGEYVTNPGTRISGTFSDTWAVNGSYETFRETLAPEAFSPTEYSLVGGTRYLVGSPADLTANDGAYMIFRSYSSAFTSRILSAHQENTTIAGTTYYQMRTTSADSGGSSLNVLISTTGRNLWSRFVYQLNGITEIPASTWTVYYRAYRTGLQPLVHCDVDVLLRNADGSIASTIATDVANSPNLGTAWSTVSGTYAWSSFPVTDETSYLEVDFYAHVTTGQSNRRAYMRIDDSGLTASLQTRVENMMLPSEYTVQVDLSGNSNTRSWQSLSWTTENAFTESGVSVVLQLYNFNTTGYSAIGEGYLTYLSSSTPNTDEAVNQTISINAEHYRNSTGGWRMRITGVKVMYTQFDLKVDWVKFEPESVDSYRLAVDGTFTLDVSTYPRAYMDSVEVLVRYRTNDSFESWFIEAYNWTGQTYSDAGFNTTAGDTPSTEFKYYSANLTTAWQDYVQSNGTIRLRFCDRSPEANQTTVDIDFIGARAAINGAKFSLQNGGSTTCHVVAIWILNATSHERYAADLFFNAGTSIACVRADIVLPQSAFIAKIVTEKGNIAVFTKE